MQNSQSWTERSFQKGYLDILQKYLTELSYNQRDEICQQIKVLAYTLAEDNKTMIVDRAARTHLRMTTLVLASYRVLLPYIKDPEGKLVLLKDIGLGSSCAWVNT